MQTESAFVGFEQYLIRKVGIEAIEELRSLVSENWTGKPGGKTEENFTNNVIQLVGFLVWKYSKGEYAKNPLTKGDAVPFSSKEWRPVGQQFQIKNIERVVKFLRSVGVLKEVKDEQGRDYSYLSTIPFCRTYRIFLKNRNILG